MTISKTRSLPMPDGLVSKECTAVPKGLHILLKQMKEYICCFNSHYSGKQQPPQVFLELNLKLTSTSLFPNAAD